MTEIPVLLLTGYLGSGKTTLLNRILSNKRGIKFAVIVNDIGEVNIDADLIEKGGIVNEQDDSLVALQNGCICCTLKMDLVRQLQDIIQMQRFDYIVIEASGICEPGPIAQTICSIPQMAPEMECYPRLDAIVTIVDALRLRDEFEGGLNLTRPNIDEEDIENLVIQQIEFCNIVLLNKAAEVTPDELGRTRQIIRSLQPKAEIIDTNYGDVNLDKIINTSMFDFDDVATSATWIQEVERHDEEAHESHESHESNETHESHETHEANEANKPHGPQENMLAKYYDDSTIGDYSMSSIMDQQLMRNVEQFVLQNMSRGQISLEDMASAMGMGRVPFFHKIRAITTKTPAEVVREIRLKHACTLLVHTNINMSELAINVGFMTAENFINIFREKYGMTPLEYRLKNKRS